MRLLIQHVGRSHWYVILRRTPSTITKADIHGIFSVLDGGTGFLKVGYAAQVRTLIYCSVISVADVVTTV